MSLIVSSGGIVSVKPSESSSSHDFDFLVGKFRCRNRRLKSRLTGSDEWEEFDATLEAMSLLMGKANLDRFYTNFGGTDSEGMTLRLFHPTTRLWSLYWTNSNIVALDVPQVGSFDGNIGTFYANDSHAGKPVICQFKWDRTNPDAPIWSQALSPDDGKTWEWNWFNYHSRV